MRYKGGANILDLQKIRIKQKLTQCEVAKKIDIAQSYYSDIEQGKKRPSVDTAKKIAKELDVDWTTFFE